MTIVRTIVLVMTIVVSPGLASAIESPDDVLFSTSYEGGNAATFHKLQDGTVQFQATGTTAISSKFART